MNKKLFIILIIVLVLIIGGTIAIYFVKIRPQKSINEEIINSDSNFQSSQCFNQDLEFLGYVKPLDKSKIVVSKAGSKIIKDQIIIMFKQEILEQKIRELVQQINAEIVGCTPDINSFQIELKGDPSIDSLESFIDALNKNPDIQVAATNNIAYPN
ncbi:hypothetical protein KJ853_02275 [Patescibacteria group bacterium]|nr:hypothetical protein [Patescibacteria group bacterium]